MAALTTGNSLIANFGPSLAEGVQQQDDSRYCKKKTLQWKQ
jgi:hypothetical protein